MLSYRREASCNFLIITLLHFFFLFWKFVCSLHIYIRTKFPPFHAFFPLLFFFLYLSLVFSLPLFFFPFHFLSCQTSFSKPSPTLIRGSSTLHEAPTPPSLHQAALCSARRLPSLRLRPPHNSSKRRRCHCR